MMSFFGLMGTFAFGTFHFCLWFGAMGIYLGYIEEVEDDGEMATSDDNYYPKNNDDEPNKGRKV